MEVTQPSPRSGMAANKADPQQSLLRADSEPSSKKRKFGWQKRQRPPSKMVNAELERGQQP